MVRIFPVLRERLSEEKSQELLRLLAVLQQSSSEQALALAEARLARRLTKRGTRLDRRFSEALHALEGRIHQRFAKLQGRMAVLDQPVITLDRRLTEELAKLHHRITEGTTKVPTALEGTRTDPIKGMFPFCIGQMAVAPTLVDPFGR